MSGPTPASEAELDEVEALIDAWAARELDGNPVVAAVERAPASEGRRWFVRVHGEEKDVFTIWLSLRQRTLHYETYVMPAPEENHAQFYEHLLRRNLKLNGMAFVIGVEDAVFLQGQLPVAAVDDDELDRILGSFYAYVEQCFRPALRIGFASPLPWVNDDNYGWVLTPFRQAAMLDARRLKEGIGKVPFTVGPSEPQSVQPLPPGWLRLASI